MYNLYNRTLEALNTKYFNFFELPEREFTLDGLGGSGWYFLGHDRDCWKQVEQINETVAVIDTETSCFLDGGINWVLMVTAVTEAGYYLWLHTSLVSESSWQEGCLVSVGDKVRIAIAHNAAFDRERILESYSEDDPIFWLDTQSLHNAQNLFCAEQRILDNKETFYRWQKYGSGSSLKESYNFHCCDEFTGLSKITDLDKETRNLFVRGESLEDLKKVLPRLIEYALNDAAYCARLFTVVWNKFLNSTPAIESRVGQLAHSNTTVYINNPALEKYLSSCEEKYQKIIYRLEQEIDKIARKLYEEWLEQTQTQTVKIWIDSLPANLKCLSWNPKTYKGVLYPHWYLQSRSISSVVAHLLIGLYWKGVAIVYDKNLGFCLEDGTPIETSKKSEGNLTRLFTKDFTQLFLNGTITSPNPLAQEIVRYSQYLSFWVSNRGRFTTFSKFSKSSKRLPAILAIATTTRRSSSKIWHVLPTPKKEKLGSGFTSFIVAPEGHRLVHADLDSVEAVIAALYNIQGTDKTIEQDEFANSVLNGIKEMGTDIHSINAKAFGISRDTAKQFLYSSLYGSGVTGLSNTLLRGNKQMASYVAKTVAKSFLERLRGTKNRVTGEFEWGIASRCFNRLIALTKTSTAGFLESHYPYPLLERHCGNNFFTSRANSGIQSVGRMLLDCWLYGIIKDMPECEFIYTVHDQVILSVPEDLADTACQIMQKSHEAMYQKFCDYLGIQLPSNIAKVTSIIIDKKLSKTPTSYGLEVFR